MLLLCWKRLNVTLLGAWSCYQSFLSSITPGAHFSKEPFVPRWEEVVRYFEAVFGRDPRRVPPARNKVSKMKAAHELSLQGQ